MNRRPRATRRFPPVLLLLAITACARGGPAAGATVLSRLDDAPPPRPGQLAWSPDGERLAVARADGVLLLDLKGGGRRLLSGPPVLAVDWAPAAELLVVERAGASARTVAVGPDGGARRELLAAPDLGSARWLGGGPSWLGVTARRQVVSFGTELELKLVRVEDGKATTLYERDDTLPTRDPRVDATSGWTAAAPNPVDGELVLPVFHKPPLFEPELRLLAVDPFDPAPAERARAEVGLWTADASWSPDGERLAFAAADGSLRLLRRSGGLEAPRGPARGRHPSWSPRGDVLFLGGWLVTPGGEPVRELLRDAAGATGVWSPDGSRLAVLDAGRLFVLGGVGGAPPADLRARRDEAHRAFWRAGELRREGLVDRGPYQRRREELWKSLEATP